MRAHLEQQKKDLQAKAIDNEKNRQAIKIVKKKREKEWERKLREMLKKEEEKEIFSR